MLVTPLAKELKGLRQDISALEAVIRGIRPFLQNRPGEFSYSQAILNLSKAPSDRILNQNETIGDWSNSGERAFADLHALVVQ
ncbi:MAG: hypothetical protein WB586_26770 [Chthoniobacterales bacterium]